MKKSSKSHPLADGKPRGVWRKTPPKHFAIPVPSIEELDGQARADSQASTESFEEAIEALEALGFIRFHTTTSLSYDNITFALRMQQRHSHIRAESWERDLAKPMEECCLMYHPAGIVLRARSSHSESTPHSKQLRGLSVDFEFTGGVSAAHTRYSALCSHLGGSRSQDMSLQGVWHEERSLSCSNTQELVRALSQMQTWGRFVPLELQVSRNLFLDKESIAPLTPAIARQFEKEEDVSVYLENQFEQGKDQLLASAPACMVPLIEASLERRKPKKEHAQKKPSGLWWVPIEYAHEYIGRVLLAAGERYPAPVTAAWVERVLRDMLDPARRDPLDTPTGPYGLEKVRVLALVYDQRHDARAPLLHWARTAPQEALERACTQPDALGMTLPLLLLRRVFRSSSLARVEEEEIFLKEIFNVLSDRLGPENLVVETERATWAGQWLVGDGVWAEAGPDERVGSTEEPKEALAWRLSQYVWSLGVRFSPQLRFSSRPNQFARPNGWPAFVALENLDAFDAQKLTRRASQGWNAFREFLTQQTHALALARQLPEESPAAARKPRL